MRSTSNGSRCGFSPEELASVRPGMSPYAKRHLPAPIEPALEPVRYTVERRGGCTILWLGDGQGRTTAARFRENSPCP